MKSSIIKLIARIEDMNSEDVSLKDVRVLAQCGTPEAIDALAGLLDDERRVGKEAARGLKRFGRAAEGALRRCLGSHNEVVARKAAELLAGLGDDAALREKEVIEKENEAAAIVAGAAAENDNEEIPAAELKWLTDREVTRAIAGTLYRRGVARQDIKDGVAEVQTRILELLRVGPPLTGQEEWKGLGVKVAGDLAFDAGRRRAVRRAREEELDDEEDSLAYAADEPVSDKRADARRVIEVFKELSEAGELPPMAREIVALRAEDMSDAEIAEELGLGKQTVWNRRKIVRRRMQWELKRRGMSDLDPTCGRPHQDDDAGPIVPRLRVVRL
jgi:DNA-directed RNA polymerase specialized sigma24 family protein